VIDEFLNQTGNRHKYFPQTTDLPSQEAPTESLEKEKNIQEKRRNTCTAVYQQHGKIQKMWLFLETTSQRKLKGQHINPT